MPNCAAAGCTNRSDNPKGKEDHYDPASKKTYHMFPKDLERKQQWIVNLNRQNFSPSVHSRLCSDHFEEWCFDRTGSIVRLRETAVPTIFSQGSKNKNIRKRKRIKRLKKHRKLSCEKKFLTNEGINQDHDTGNISGFNVVSNTDKNIEAAMHQGEYLSEGKIKLEDQGRIFMQGRGKSEDSRHSKTKMIKLPDNNTYFEFAAPLKNLVVQLKNKERDINKLKVENLDELLNHLKSRQLISSTHQDLLEAFGALPAELEKISDTLESEPSTEISEEVNKFASLLYTFSPRAFEFVGKIFRLPGRNILQERMRVTGYRPGFTQESLTILKDKLPEMSACKMCSIMISFIDLKKQRIYDSDSGCWIGHIESGGGENPHEAHDVPLASEVLLFTVVGLGRKWKLPFGYFLTQGLSGEELHSLVREAIVIIESCDICVKALVCDGSSSTIEMGECFGCKIHTKPYNEIVTFFSSPFSQQKIHLLFSYQNSFTLLRHLLEDYSILRSSVYGIIKWRFLKQLYDINESKMSVESVSERCHQFFRLKRTLELCNLDFSEAASKALYLANGIGWQAYTGSRSTANFIADLHRAFALLNSRYKFSKDKPTLSKDLLTEQVESMSVISERIFDLELPSCIPVNESYRWMSTTLLPFTLKSLAHLASEIIENGFVDLATSRLNLNHSSQILSCLQKRGQWNGMPNAAEFQNGYKKLITQVHRLSSYSRVYNEDFEGEDLTVDQMFLDPIRTHPSTSTVDENLFYSLHLSEHCTDDVVAGMCIALISRRLSCTSCIALMLSNDMVKSKISSYSCIVPSELFIEILKISKIYLSHNLLVKADYNEETLVLNTAQKCLAQNWFLKFHLLHATEEPHHFVSLVKVFIRTLVKIRLKGIMRLIKTNKSLNRKFLYF